MDESKFNNSMLCLLNNLGIKTSIGDGRSRLVFPDGSEYGISYRAPKEDSMGAIEIKLNEEILTKAGLYGYCFIVLATTKKTIYKKISSSSFPKQPCSLMFPALFYKDEQIIY